jgi:hypothetical protein
MGLGREDCWQIEGDIGHFLNYLILFNVYLLKMRILDVIHDCE